MPWTRDDWPRALGGDLSKPLPKPANVPGAAHGLALSGSFVAADLGRKMAFYKPAPNYLNRVRFDDGALILQAQGKDRADASPLAFNVGDRSYTMSVDVEVRGGAFGGCSCSTTRRCSVAWTATSIGLVCSGPASRRTT